MPRLSRQTRPVSDNFATVYRAPQKEFNTTVSVIRSLGAISGDCRPKFRENQYGCL